MCAYYVALCDSAAPRINASRVGFLKNLNCEESLQLVCYLEEDSELANIIWKKTDTEPDVIFQPGETLHVNHPVTPGVYECIATNDHGRDTQSVVVISKGKCVTVFTLIICWNVAGLFLELPSGHVIIITVYTFPSIY